MGRSLGWRKGRNYVEMPKLNEGNIVVKALSTSFCQFHCLAFNLEPGMDNGVKVPTTTGHQATGAITETGQQVTQFIKGDASDPLALSGCYEYETGTAWH
ncbi:hypothetical protein BHE90_011794 [Fusarium euwallaceae]|uniref:Alcohol dehydrogenase-like N-terminal domain-containing protein n=1 Tax=Fusarium euwallaceae TaxID=1147111 RepID=A0A430LDL1_9HYPO|nr:hypothetical protein BHE90_011794 [Fusarium euwallaceae]